MMKKFEAVRISNNQSLKQISGGITIEEYRRICLYLAKHNPEQLAAVQAQFDAGAIQFE